MGISDGESNRHGGGEHKYWIGRIGSELKESGYTVAEEVRIGGGKAIDLVATRDGKRIAFEIETGKSNAVANVQKCLAAGTDRVVVVATSRRTRDRLAPALPDDPRVLCLYAADVLTRFVPGRPP